MPKTDTRRVTSSPASSPSPPHAARVAAVARVSATRAVSLVRFLCCVIVCHPFSADKWERSHATVTAITSPVKSSVGTLPLCLDELSRSPRRFWRIPHVISMTDSTQDGRTAS
ncbi:hypothetical protein NOCA2280026 [metagenome]|uniref:Uncharacterized protein n=1 Tax=metagenome TaxID=256318 RepID=A0A2P2C0S1_9ZZZZ